MTGRVGPSLILTEKTIEDVWRKFIISGYEKKKPSVSEAQNSHK